MIKNRLFTILASLLLVSPLSAEIGDFGGIIELEGGTLNISDHTYLGISGGFSYESPYGRHSLIISAGEVHRTGIPHPFGGGLGRPDPTIEASDATMFSIGYRHGFTQFEKFEPFLEIGLGTSEWDDVTSDALGNAVSIGRDSTFLYLSAGLLYQVHKDIHLKAEITYLSFADDVFGAQSIDALGNPVFLSQEANFMATFGIAVKF